MNKFNGSQAIFKIGLVVRVHFLVMGGLGAGHWMVAFSDFECDRVRVLQHKHFSSPSKFYFILPTYLFSSSSPLQLQPFAAPHRWWLRIARADLLSSSLPSDPFQKEHNRICRCTIILLRCRWTNP